MAKARVKGVCAQLLVFPSKKTSMYEEKNAPGRQHQVGVNPHEPRA